MNHKNPLFLTSLLTLCVVQTILFFPDILALDKFIAGDNGANLNLGRLFLMGKIPSIDFGYSYGMIPYVLSGIFGLQAHPFIFVAVIFLIKLVIIFYIYHFAQSLKLTTLQKLVILVGFSHTVFYTYSSITHALEALFIIITLSLHCRKEYKKALAVLAICCFIKPSMVYVYGVALLTCMYFRRQLTPSNLKSAALVFSLLLISFALIFGWWPAVNSILPLTGAKHYEVFNYGFWTQGIHFAFPKDATLNYYIGSPAGFWVLASMSLLLGSVLVLFRKTKGLSLSIEEEIVSVIAVLHFTFVLVFWGGPSTYQFYCYLLVLGSVLLYSMGKIWKKVVWILLLTAFTTNYSAVTLHINSWKTKKPHKELLYCWASPEEYREWLQMKKVIQTKESVVLSKNTNSIDLPPSKNIYHYFLIGGYSLPKTIKRKLLELHNAEIVIIPYNRGFTRIPEIDNYAKNFSKPLFDGKFFKAYEKVH